MTKAVLATKLENLRKCLKRIEAKTPASLAILKKDLDAQDIIAVNLDVAAPATMADSFDALQKAGAIGPRLARSLKKAVGLRNVLVHEYDEINWAIVYAVATKKLPDLRAFMKAVASYRSL